MGTSGTIVAVGTPEDIVKVLLLIRGGFSSRCWRKICKHSAVIDRKKRPFNDFVAKGPFGQGKGRKSGVIHAAVDQLARFILSLSLRLAAFAPCSRQTFFDRRRYQYFPSRSSCLRESACLEIVVLIPLDFKFVESPLHDF